MFDAKPSEPDVAIDLIIWLNLRIRMTAMPKTFKIGEHVRWNSEAGRVSGIIIKKITSDMKFKGYVHHASQEAPQYLIKSDKTEHVAIHKGTARRLIPPRTRKSSRTTDETEETMTNDERIATGVECTICVALTRWVTGVDNAAINLRKEESYV